MSRLPKIKMLFFVIALLISMSSAAPQTQPQGQAQRQSQRQTQTQLLPQGAAQAPSQTSSQVSSDIAAAIMEIFSTASPASGSGVRRGFNEIVTPLPIDPTSEPQVLATNDGNRCTCVPYHMCDPNSQSVRDEENNDDGFLKIDIRFNPDPATCQHFLDVCCLDNRTLTTSVSPRPVEPLPNRPTGCGIRNVGGIDFELAGNNDNESGFGEFPWTVAFLHALNHSYFCSGSLIHSQVVLTAAHCVRTLGLNDFLVRAGEWDSQTTKERLPYEERSPRQIAIHPNFNVRNIANDFALVILNEAVPMTDHISTVCLPPANFVPMREQICFSSGWGKDQFGQAGQYSAILKRVPLPIVPFDQCQQAFRGTRLGNRFILDPSFVCAGGVRNIDTCQGDGGAPLVCPTGLPTQNRYHQTGIVAWGIGCNDELPGAYASVSYGRPWIDQQMAASGFGTTTYTA